MKKMKKFVAFLLVAMMMLSMTSMFAAAEEEAGLAEGTAYICFSDSAWGIQYWGEKVQYGDNMDVTGWTAQNATVTGNGTYTVSVDVTNLVDAEGNALPGSDLAFFDVEIKNGENLFPNCYMTIDSVKINGAEVEVGTTYTSSDNKAETRTNLYNSWVPDATTVENARTADGSNEGITAAPIASTIGEIKTIEVTFTLGDGVLCNVKEVESELSTEEYDVFIGIGGDYTDAEDWGVGYDGTADVAGITAVNGKLKSGETTTISLTFDQPVVNTWWVAPCMVIEDPTTLAANSTFDIKVYIDDVEVTPDFTLGDMFWAEGTGNATVRLAGGYNEWGTQYITKPTNFSKITYEITPQIYIAEPVVEEQPEFDPDGTYYAYIGFQTPKYSFRNAWDDKDYGKDSDVFNQITAWDEENNAYSKGGTFTDVEISANGTYTVKVEGWDDWAADFADQDTFNLLFVSSTLPKNDACKVTNIVLKMDGKEIATIDEAFLDPDGTEYQKILLANTYNTELEALPYYAVPTESIEISFTVSGFNKELEVEATPTPEPTEAPTATSTPAPTQAPDDDKKDDSKDGNGGLIAGIIAGVVVVAGGAGAVIAKKKKK